MKRFTLLEIVAGIVEPHTIQVLFEHLSTAEGPRCTEMDGETEKLEILRIKSGNYSETLVSPYRSLLNSLTGTGNPIHIDESAR